MFVRFHFMHGSIHMTHKRKIFIRKILYNFIYIFVKKNVLIIIYIYILMYHIKFNYNYSLYLYLYVIFVKKNIMTEIEK